VIRAASWVVAALSGLAGVAALTVATPAPANASTAYRYWAFYLAHGNTWQYAQRGPASEYPADGDVEGWRFAVQVDTASGLTPRDVPDFATLCASSPAKAGDIRVGLVIDFGAASDAPAHESPPAGVVPGCVYVHDGDSAAAVLQAAATIRIGTGPDAGLVCGIDSYPKTECAPAVTVTTTTTAAPTAKTPPAPPTATRKTPAPTTTPVAVSSAALAASSVAPEGSLTPGDATSPLGSFASAVVPLGAAGLPPSPTAASSLNYLRSSSGGSGAGLTAVVGGVLVVAIGGAAIWRARRGRP
jgi:hypothetical protein